MSETTIEELRRKGNSLLAGRRPAEAVTIFEAMIRDYPNDARGYDGLARSLDRLGHLSELVERLEEPARRLRYPRLLRTIADAVRALEARGQKDLHAKAILLYEEYLETTEDAAAREYLGALYREADDDEKAISSFRRAWDIEPRNANAYKAMLNLLREHGRTSEIEEAKELWRVRNPKRA